MEKIYTILLFITCFSCVLPTKEWVNYENKKFGYKAIFPEQPTLEDRMIGSPLGEVPVQAVSAFEYSSPERNNLFTISCTQFPIDVEDDSENILEKLVKRMQNRMKGELVYDKNIEVAGYPAKEFRIEFTKAPLKGVNHLTIRAFVKENLQFILQTISEKEKDNSASIDKFMNSFVWIE